VEDDAVFQETLARALRARGLEVVTASDRAGAREAVGSAFDAAIVDVRLGSDSGMEVAADILGIHPSTRVVLATGAPRTSLPQGLPPGVASILIKPFDADQVLAALFPGDGGG
jgi:two-component system response regulator RegA